jgi:hypothetical protein
MHLAPTLREPDLGRLWSAFPHWINSSHASFEGMQFHAAASANDLSLDLAVTMSEAGGSVASYKCGIIPIRDRRSGWIVLVPLVVVWRTSTPAGRFSLGRTMVDHLSAAASEFHRTHQACDGTILIASGNLTEEKGGAQFFRALGWDIVTPRKRDTQLVHLDEPRLIMPLTIIEEQINKALAPMRAAGKIGDEPISFAVRQLRP